MVVLLWYCLSFGSLGMCFMAIGTCGIVAVVVTFGLVFLYIGDYVPAIISLPEGSAAWCRRELMYVLCVIAAILQY
jgi:hypothetical protein